MNLISYLNTCDINYLRSSLRAAILINTIYLNIPKCACTTIKRFLWQISSSNNHIEYDNRIQFDTDIAWSFRYKPEHIKKLNRPFIFTISRNPFSRIFLAYISKVINPYIANKKLVSDAYNFINLNNKHSFYDFLKFIQTKPQHDWDPHWRLSYYQIHEGKINIDFIGSLENFTQDMSKILSVIIKINKLDCGNASLENLNSSGSKYLLPEFFGKKETELVRALYKKDFEFFRYSDNLEDHQIKPYD